MSTWNIVRLELGRTDDFPSGSISRSYQIRIPLDDEGLIDEAARLADPARATIRRYWPNEPDQSGYVTWGNKGWVYSDAVGKLDDKNLFFMENCPIRAGELLTLTEYDGIRRPYRIMSVTPV